MPLPGDQHRDTPATTNPFHDPKHHISEYTAQEIATLQSRLEKQLGPEYISTRPGNGGGKVHYLAAEKVINLANEVFGFNGWSSSIQNVQIDFVDEHPQSGKITLGLSTIVRVTLRDGTFHEDIGYGHIENCKGKAAAFEKAKKEAATDALKRALRNFGNVLGNCLYDKDYLQKITKVKVAPSRWDADNLHRHPDYAPIKKESIAGNEAVQQEKATAVARQSSVQSGVSYGSAEFEDDFGGSGLDDVDFTHPDEVRLDDTTMQAPETPAQRAINGPQQAQRQGVPRMHSMPQLRPPNVQSPQRAQGPPAPQRPPGVQNVPQQQQQVPNRMPPPLQAAQQRAMQQQQQHQANMMQKPQQQQHSHSEAPRTNSNPSSATTVADSPSNIPPNETVPSITGQDLDDRGLPIPRQPPPDIPAGFVTGRSVDLLNRPPDTRPTDAIRAFDPHAESPSIRRTHGVNPGKSAPVTRTALSTTGATGGGGGGGLPPGAQRAPIQAHAGATTSANRSGTDFVNPSLDISRRIGAPQQAGGLSNRGAYRPPSAVVPVKRPPLADVSNLPAQMDGPGDAKKVKLGGEVGPGAGTETVVPEGQQNAVGESGAAA
ncbi:DNA repair protein rad52 [Recurvomyces mirabilis]|uniref:RAD52 homolog n=1 Tax=Recurvomyces mirabilis TaxID=574656 RepID=A0AAE0WGH4_9PEZI|nr:DNA repair protein rad52 [Recurvomyces mirabilis]KAK5152134.1 DNA repair protein rad52 [Recurvomyces mirabilis]